MKKLLGIVVLGLMLSGNAYAEEIVLDCKGISASVDGKVEAPAEKRSRTIVSHIQRIPSPVNPCWHRRP